MITLEDFVRREVIYCVSSLVHTLANLEDTLGDQARDLYNGQPDYEEAAREAGWEGPHRDKFGVTYFEDTTDGATWVCKDWKELWEDQDIGYDGGGTEILEHWIVSDWLADKLIEKGETVDKDFAGLTVWGRSTTGQAISMDYVIQEIYKEMMK